MQCIGISEDPDNFVLVMDFSREFRNLQSPMPQIEFLTTSPVVSDSSSLSYAKQEVSGEFLQSVSANCCTMPRSFGVPCFQHNLLQDG